MHIHRPILIEEPGRPARRGFSLIELVMVLTIISILSAIAVPRYTNSLMRYRADAAADRVVADLEYARQLALSSSSNVTVNFKIDQECVVLEGVANLNDSTLEWGTPLNQAPYHANLVSVSFTGAKLTFDGYGIPDSGGTAVLSVGSEGRVIVLDPDTGKAGVQ